MLPLGRPTTVIRTLDPRGLLLGALAPLFLSPAAPAQSLARASVDSGGGEAVADSYGARISADGRFVVFESFANDLVAGDQNLLVDVFVHDRVTGATQRVSVSTGGFEAHGGDSGAAAISADGRFVAFESLATDLVPSDSNFSRDIFVRDRLTGGTERVSVATGGVQVFGDSFSPDISNDGRFVVFWSFSDDYATPDVDGWADVFVHDRTLGTTVRISQTSGGLESDGNSHFPAISGNGRFVAYHSSSTNLVAGDTRIQDILVFDRVTGLTEKASVSSLGASGTNSSWYPDISSDGRFVVFESFAPNLVFGDLNNLRDVFLRDRLLGTTERISVSTAGDEGDDASRRGTVSDDGRFVVFESFAGTMVLLDQNHVADVFLRDRTLVTTARISLDSGGGEADGPSERPSISGSGRIIAFHSQADDLVTSDLNHALDAFALDQGFPTAHTFCFGDGSGTACPCANPGQSGKGCNNSLANGGARLAAQGAPVVSADTVLLAATDLPMSTIVLFFQGDATSGGGAGTVFGDGLLCAAGNVVRLVGRQAAGGNAYFGTGVGGDPTVSAAGAVPAGGGTRYYQGWYRNGAPFCTPAQFNLTNALEIVWMP